MANKKAPRCPATSGSRVCIQITPGPAEDLRREQTQLAGSALLVIRTACDFTLQEDSRVTVWGRIGPGLSDLSVAVVKDIVSLHSEALIVGIKVSDDGTIHVVEVSVLNKHLCAFTRVDARSRDILVATGVDVTGTKAK